MPIENKIIYIPFHGSSAEAKKELTRLLAILDKGLFVDPSKMTVEEYMNYWLDNYAKLKVADRTFNRYKEFIDNNIVPEIGNLKIQKLRPIVLQQMYTNLLTNGRKKGGGLSPTTVHQIHSVMHKALVMAVKWQVVTRNIADAVDPPRPANSKPVILNESQAKHLLQRALTTPYYLQVLLAIMTGMRRGEIYGLIWDNIDFEAGKINVVQSTQYIPKQGLGEKGPKSEEGFRIIDVTDYIISVLKTVKEKQTFENEEGYVFIDKDARQHPDSISSWFPEFIVSIGLPRLRFHDLRHTHASLLLHIGESLKLISERLGHSSVEFTADIYTHLLPGMQKAAAEKLEKSILPEVFSDEKTSPECRPTLPVDPMTTFINRKQSSQALKTDF